MNEKSIILAIGLFFPLLMLWAQMPELPSAPPSHPRVWFARVEATNDGAALVSNQAVFTNAAILTWTNGLGDITNDYVLLGKTDGVYSLAFFVGSSNCFRWPLPPPPVIFRVHAVLQSSPDMVNWTNEALDMVCLTNPADNRFFRAIPQLQ